MGNDPTVKRILTVTAGMKPQDIINSKKANELQKKLAYVFDADGIEGYSQREADVFNATLITDRGAKGISLFTRYQDGSIKETKHSANLDSFKFAPRGEVKPYEICTCPMCQLGITLDRNKTNKPVTKSQNTQTTKGHEAEITNSLQSKKKDISPKDLEGLTVVTDTNFVGGISHCFDEESIQKLKSRIYMPDTQLDYRAPIENDKNVYLEPFGYFFANRPNGKKSRPHLGLDIYVSPYSRKPKEPVLIQAPVDGVVISHKRARKEDNVIANCVILLGRDGRRYTFDHMARPEDYTDSIPMPTVGTILKAGDPIGYVGNTGETSMWHLHLSIMTDEQLEKQNTDEYWQKISSQSRYSKLKGQVNPLNPEEAGPIANFLSEYRGGELNSSGNFKLEE